MKKILILLTVFLFMFTACGTTETPEQANSLENYSADLFEIQYPAGWEVKTKVDLGDSVPNATLVIFRSREEKGNIFPVIAIAEEGVNNGTSSLIYARSNVENTPKVLTNFQTISKDEMDINGQKTVMFSFSGRTSEDAMDLMYYQTYFVKGSKGITVAAVLPVGSDDNYKNWIQSSLKTFRFK